MAVRKPVEIILGEKAFVIRPLTIDQVERIEAVMDGKAGIRQAHEIVAIGLSRDHAEVAHADLETTVPELSEAMTAILRQGGFLPEQSVGEAQAAAASAPIG